MDDRETWKHFCQSENDLSIDKKKQYEVINFLKNCSLSLKEKIRICNDSRVFSKYYVKHKPSSKKKENMIVYRDIILSLTKKQLEDHVYFTIKQGNILKDEDRRNVLRRLILITLTEEQFEKERSTAQKDILWVDDQYDFEYWVDRKVVNCDDVAYWKKRAREWVRDQEDDRPRDGWCDCCH